MGSLADDLRKEAEQLRRRFVHHTRPKRVLSMDEAKKFAAKASERPCPKCGKVGGNNDCSLCY